MKCILTRANVKIWVTDKEAENVIQALNSGSKWLQIKNEYVNTADVSGIHTEETILVKLQEERGLVRIGSKGEWKTKREDLFLMPYIPHEDDKQLNE